MKSINRLAAFCLLGIEVTAMSLSARPSVGFFPMSFPRDPVEVNVYLEHILLGQILEPLVESGPDGTILPAVASGWEISPDGLTVRFFFKNEIRFSNGNRVTAEDAKYTLERHIHSLNSQSKSYLKRIRKLEVRDPQELILQLDAPYVALLKALSRDHLGIVPKGWKFDAGSQEPLIGTGAYRAVKENKSWILKKNVHFRQVTSVDIPEWDLAFQRSIGDAPSHIPDLVPFAYGATVDQLKQTDDWKSGLYVEEPVTHFFQSSAWWYPNGASYKDEDRRRLGMCAVREWIEVQTKGLGLHRATGLIPEGITGHLPQLPPSDCSIQKGVPKNRKFTIVALRREFSVLNDEASRLAVQKKYGVELKLLSLELSAPESALTELKPDIFVLAFAGGFHDPEGFLTVINAMLCSDPKTVFQTDYELYLKASADTNWETRSAKYQAVNSSLSSNLRMVPGWKVPAERVRNKRLISNRNDLRYTAKLKDYELRKE